MLRRSMIVGWWELLTNRSRRKHSGDSTATGSSGDDFDTVRATSAPPRLKRISVGKPLDSKKGDDLASGKPPGVIPSPEISGRQMSVPEPGDATKRHETTNLFEESDVEDDGCGDMGRNRKRVKEVEEDDIV